MWIWKKIYNDLGSNIFIICRFYNYSEWLNYCQWPRASLVQKLFPNNKSRWEFVHTGSQKCSVLVWGASRCSSTSSLASIITTLEYHWATAVSLREQREKQTHFPIISQATRRCSLRRVVQYSSRDCSECIWVYSKKDTCCITGKWWPNSILTF